MTRARRITSTAPWIEEEYTAFVRGADRTREEAAVHGFDDGSVFEGCMPVEVMARRGRGHAALRPAQARRPAATRAPGASHYAVVQLRRDNAEGTHL